ncbi:MAG: glycerol-3-phosphate acyltransferase [Clostridiales bacterium]|nr:glycerol-3-phosphate acyltransferase [Clostridiales bacterium]
MTSAWINLFFVIGGYLIGSISFARLVFASLKPSANPDLIRTPTTDGKAELVSHAVGATNVMIAFGPRWGTFVTILDMLKAFIPTLVLRLLFPEESYHLVVAVTVLVGHLWPVWYRFSGGGGNSCIIWMLLAISPLGLLTTHAGGMLIGRFVPMFSFVGGIALTIPWFAIRDGIFSLEVVFSLAITFLYIIAELPEIRQIRNLKRHGYKLDYGFVLSMMKRSAATREPGKTAGNKGLKSDKKHQ